MITFEAPNINIMARKVYDTLSKLGVESDSRNGRVLRFMEPITTTYTKPWNRVGAVYGRDANHVFHHMESLWMLAGRDDVGFLNMFNSKIHEYSDDGGSFNAPYGWRIRKEFEFDQLTAVIDTLSTDMESRQAVIQIWRASDLIKETKDKACNMMLVFSRMWGGLQLTVYNRSNDLIYGGVTGTNPVHFSYIQEYVAEQLGWDMGHLIFVSNNAHVYLDLYPHWERMNWGVCSTFPADKLEIGSLKEIEYFCKRLMSKEILNETFHSPMLEYLSKPMWNYWCSRKYSGEYNAVQYWLDRIEPLDWKLAINEWDIKRR